MFSDLDRAINESTEHLGVEGLMHPDRSPEFDWQLLKQKIDMVLAKYLQK